jgi:glycerol-3-phosphate acyltransferase PlsY
MFSLDTLIWLAAGLLLGAMPFSFWLGRLLLQTDIRRYGDGNPGAANAWQAGGWQVGLPALLLDYLKGLIPVGLAYFIFGVSGWGLVAVALGPILGHAFSPFLRGQGGKALAVTFGVWTGLTLGEGPLILGLFMGLFLLVQREDAWAVILGMAGFLVYLLLRQADPFILLIWLGNMLILIWKHRQNLRQGIRLRPRTLNWLRPSQ